MFLIRSFILWKIVFTRIPFVIENTASFILNWFNKKAYFIEIVLLLVDSNMECEDGGAEPQDWLGEQVQTVQAQHSHLLGLAQGEEVGGELGVDNDRVETVNWLQTFANLLACFLL